MHKNFIYKCQFSSLNDLTKTLGYFTIRVRCHNLKEAKQHLRSLGFHLGKDFLYWKLPDYSPSSPLDVPSSVVYKNSSL